MDRRYVVFIFRSMLWLTVPTVLPLPSHAFTHLFRFCIFCSENESTLDSIFFSFNKSLTTIFWLLWLFIIFIFRHMSIACMSLLFPIFITIIFVFYCRVLGCDVFPCVSIISFIIIFCLFHFFIARILIDFVFWLIFVRFFRLCFFTRSTFDDDDDVEWWFRSILCARKLKANRYMK